MSESLLDALEKCGPEDLETLDREIGIVARRLKTLRQARKIVAAKCGDRKLPATNGAASSASRRAATNGAADRKPVVGQSTQQILDLLGSEGPMLAPTVARRLQLSQRSVSMAVAKSPLLKLDEHGKVAIAKGTA